MHALLLLTFAPHLLHLAAPAGAPADPTSPAVTIVMEAPDAAGLGPDLAGRLSALIPAAIESGGGYQVVSPAPSTGDAAAAEGAWRLDVSVTGKGPWRLSARSVPERATTRGRVATRKYSFSGEQDLLGAIDQLAAELDAGWRSESAPVPALTGPVPLVRALSPSPRAVDGYLDAMRALHGKDAARARTLLDEALAVDPLFGLAAAEKGYLELTLGNAETARQAVEAAGATRPAGYAAPSPFAEEVLRGMHLVVTGDRGRALQVGELMKRRMPRSRWGRTIRGLSFVAFGQMKESAEDWRAAVASDPDDPRGRMWLGLCAMATGDFKVASEELGRARAGLPMMLRVYTLEAEAQARLRETAAARAVLTDMKAYMSATGLRPTSDDTNPDLMLGSVDLLEGHFKSALKTFETALDALTAAGVTGQATYLLYDTIVEMKRDLVTSRDPLTRDRQLDDVSRALDRYEAALPAELRAARPWILLRLQGLMKIKQGDTTDAWKIVEQIKSFADRPGYTPYDEAYLSAATMLKEGDDRGAEEEFTRAAQARNGIVELMEVGQAQSRLKKYAEAHKTYEEVDKRLAAYETPVPADPNSAGAQPPSELVLSQPHLAALLPQYHYARAELAYNMGNSAESRYHFNRLLKYYQRPDESVEPMVKEAYLRGATPE